MIKDDIKVGDIMKSGATSSPYKVLVVTDFGVVAALCAVTPNSQTCIFFPNEYIETKGWHVIKPLSKTEKVAKELLESIGFKVER